MGVNWNLDVLYKGFDDPKFIEQLNAADSIISKFGESIQSMTSTELPLESQLSACIKGIVDVYSQVQPLSSFISLTLSVDSTNKLANKYNVQLNTKMSRMAKPLALLKEFISKVPNLDAVISKSPFLQQHAFFLKEIKRQQMYALPASSEDVLAKMRTTGSSAWANYKNKLISTHRVNILIDGKKQQLPLTEVLTLAYSNNQAVRKTAYEAEIASYATIEEGVAAALNAIKGEALAEAEIRKYNSVIQMTLENSKMKPITLYAMIKSIEDILPIFREYLKRKAKILGHTSGLPWYDLFAPVVEKDMPFSYEEGVKFVTKHFRTFSDNLANFAHKAVDNDWIDVYPKPGKVGGAFCSGLGPIRECRILLNYGNTIKDVSTFAHELGHGFHNQCLDNEAYLNRNYPMPLAETASIICETIVKKAALSEAGPEEKLAILEAEICGATQVIVDIYSRYLFEESLFEARKDGYVSVDVIKELMTEAQEKAYGDGLDKNFLHPYMWTWKSHYYSANRNYYNFPYAFGLLFAKGLYAKYLEDKVNFPTQYEKLLSVTGKMSIEEVANTLNINVSRKEFWQASLSLIKEDIEEFLKLTDK